jgi:NAD(P)-dependent dehydrogenase (short-subunit alcohol dehydrogenase family)
MSVRRAVVTGAGRGIGAVIAQRLEEDGYEVARLDIAGDGVIRCDVTNDDDVRAAAEKVGPVDVLVNNAGIWRFTPLRDTSSKDFLDVIKVNVLGPFQMARAFVDGMIARGGGSIVNIVSIAGTNASPAVGSYTPSKAGLLALTRLMAVEWGPLGVRCNAVGPGLIPTEGAGVYGDPEVKAARAAAVPIGRLGTPLDIANAVAFFASEQSSYVNGQALFVDGGLTQSLMTFLPRPKGVAGPQLKK